MINMKDANLHLLLLVRGSAAHPDTAILKGHKKAKSRKGVLAQVMQGNALQAPSTVISNVVALCSQSSSSAHLLLCAEAASCSAARVVCLMLTDRHINNLAFPANGDPGLKQKIPEVLQCIFMRHDLFCNCMFWLSAHYVQ